MNDQQAAAILTAHNEWRRGGDGETTDPKTLGLALERAIARLREPAGVGGEWVLVPREPTPDMVCAGFLSKPDPSGIRVDEPMDAPSMVWRAMLAAAPQPPAEAQADPSFAEWLATEMPAGTVIGDPAWWANRIARQHAKRCKPAEAQAQAQGGGEVPEAELIALVAGPYHYHHKMDEAAGREGKAFDRCRELTIQNIRTWCATRRAMRAAAPPSAPVGVETVDAESWIEVLELPEGFRVAEHLPGIWEYQFDIDDEADEDSDRKVSGASWNHPALAAIAAWGHAYDTLAQQPAAVECPHRTRCDCLAACKYGYAGGGAIVESGNDHG